MVVQWRGFISVERSGTIYSADTLFTIQGGLVESINTHMSLTEQEQIILRDSELISIKGVTQYCVDNLRLGMNGVQLKTAIKKIVKRLSNSGQVQLAQSVKGPFTKLKL